ncbi:MAG: SurA N-terminal domain-containing protein [Clostridiaceae bacterium]|nr:SurA N-terminal domain-containing protein [Clostridiaceae bacterium]
MFSKKSLLVLVVGLVAILMIGCTTENNNSANDLGEMGDVVATVNGVDIDIEVFQDTVEQMMFSYEQQGFALEGEEGEEILEQIKQQAINSLVQQEVLLQEAKQGGYDVPDEMVEEELESIKTQFPTEEEFEMALQESQLTENALKDMLVDEMQIEQLIQSKVKEVAVSEDEVKETYEQYKMQMELQMEGAEEVQEMPSFEEVKDQLEAQIQQGKQQEQIGQIIEELMEKSEIQIFI